MSRLLIILLITMLVVLQYRLWVGEGSMAEVHSLEKQQQEQQREQQKLRARNHALQAEVVDLKKGLEAVEQRARSELGMIREGETFYQIIHPQGAGGGSDGQ